MLRGLTKLARELRRTETAAEKLLWSRLRNRQIDGWKFKRQVPLAPYILDFFCVDALLVIEVDGGTHSDPEDVARDVNRTAFLEAQGLRIVRVWNADVRDNIDGVLDMIYQELGQQPAPSPGVSCRRQASGLMRRPLPKGRGEAGAPQA